MSAPAPIKVTDLVSKSLEELSIANTGSADPATIARHERNAATYSELATAQSAKTANIIAYLNSDHSVWDPTDHAVVRVMLGLHGLSSDEGGGESVTDAIDPVIPPTVEDEIQAAPEIEPVAEPVVEPNPPVPVFEGEPTFA